jgi:hypothetical protein
MPTHRRTSVFYAHLVGTAVLQLVVMVMALAVDAVDAWIAVAIVTSSLGLGAHGYAVLQHHPASSRR